MAEIKPEEGGFKIGHDKHYQEVWWLLAALILIGALVNRFLYLVGQSSWYGVSVWQALVEYFIWFWPIWKIVSLTLALGAVAWGIYSFLRLQKVETEDEKIFGKPHDDSFVEELTGVNDIKQENEQWKKIEWHVNSNSEANWRLAILEADIMLEDLLKTLGYFGDGVGEMLKSVDPTDMLTLNNAWDAHKVRNRIAHDGSNFQLTEREAKRVISLFEAVFREFRII